LELANEKAGSDLQFAEKARDRVRALVNQSIGSASELQSAEKECQIAYFTLKQAEERHADLKSIAKNSPHLNPDNFDVNESLQPVQ